MKVSVVIPMYNSENTIVNTLDSIRRQTAIDDILEIIVVNDGSKDGSYNKVLNYSNQFPEIPIVLINKPNGGVSSARNVGMKMAKGNWIALLDSDDEWLQDKIKIQLNILDENEDIDFLGGPFDDRMLKIFHRKIDKLYKAKVEDICIKNFPQPSTVIFRRGIVDAIGGFDESQRYAEDGNYFMKICNKFNLYYYPERLIIYDGGKRGFGSRGLSANLAGMYEGNLKNIRELKNEKVISIPFYVFLRVFYYVKYIRRILISRFNSR